MLRCRLGVLVTVVSAAGALVVVPGGVAVPHGKVSGVSRALDRHDFAEAWPYGPRDLTPEDAGNDGAFYLLPKLVHHAADESRAALTRFYECVLTEDCGAVLDLCSSFTSHYPPGWQARDRCAILGLNPLELVLNPSKTEWTRRDLNADPTLPYEDAAFDLVTNALSVDYITDPLAVFREMRRVLRPGGLATAAFTNRCFPSKVVPIWLRPFTDVHHAQIVANYFHHSDGWQDITVVDVSPDGWAGQQNPMIVVCARKAPPNAPPGDGKDTTPGPPP